VKDLVIQPPTILVHKADMKYIEKSEPR